MMRFHNYRRCHGNPMTHSYQFLDLLDKARPSTLRSISASSKIFYSQYGDPMTYEQYPGALKGLSLRLVVCQENNYCPGQRGLLSQMN